MAEGRIDIEGLAERAETAVNDVREGVTDAVEDLKRKGLEALVAVGTSAAEALEEMDAGSNTVEPGEVEPENPEPLP